MLNFLFIFTQKWPVLRKLDLLFKYIYGFVLYTDYLSSLIWERRKGFNLDPHPVLIIGMHRSGTSAVSGMLSIAGLFMGTPSSLMRKTEDNSKGYFENNKVLAVNELILRHFGLRWDSAVPLPENWLDSHYIKRLGHRTKVILKREFYGQKKWGMKDPRFCATFPFWKAIFPEMSIVITLREKAYIIKSLDKRTSKPRDSAALTDHYLSKLQHIIDTEKVTIVDFQRILDKDEEEIRRTLEYVGLEKDNIRGILEFIDPALSLKRT
jgi:hypothetical protein